ncbi:hypothetical protein [Agromyces aerolatus]|uniref:hypothetical protein n=1 Tax=Agromyces sp. LY-1074 TaxID=3074080 RepID=UPI00285F9656|nr:MULTISPECIES: hypothetical protein [unclassified Agromyces]MDR5699668.1 hypothetical protein [Agromyces sp. LY-1074]MDR5705964.1 hypothetical protein [Agromyces sp. LY-1358]
MLGRALAAASLTAPAVFIVLSFLRWSMAMPDELAFHWDFRGRVDGTIPADALLGLALGGACAGLAAGLVSLLVPRLEAKDRRAYLLVAGASRASARLRGPYRRV